MKQEDYKQLTKAHTRVEFLKIKVLLNEGNTSNEYYLIEEGLFRAYVHDYNGNEITTQFFGPNEILIEVTSLFLRVPSKENLNALTDGIAYKIEFDVFQQLFNSIYGFTEWGRSWMTNQLFISKQRALNMLIQSAT